MRLCGTGHLIPEVVGSDYPDPFTRGEKNRSGYGRLSANSANDEVVSGSVL